MTDDVNSSIEAGSPKREQVKERSQELAVSLWYTYNQHFKVANGYRYCRVSIDVMTAVIGGILTYALIWDGVSTDVMIALAVTIAVLTGIRSAVKPGKQESQFRQSANEYKYLFDGVRDFLKLEIEDPSKSTDELVAQYRDYNNRRRELNRDAPDAGSLWHKYVQWRVGDDGPDDISVTDAEIQKIMGSD
ncbi:hypothetical protein KM295_15230 [Natronomonas sp. F2-12]|jgi:hypothetical protein|uniref:SMODS and SLOG-associating 2TM effector domain-containing protein n=1 Tax=Natronomonas aquatica TaxID=2841590 RepID=A0A9R1CWF5_9EURY|nr:hypothetical protein [Natronomonas aquatica]MCQ4334806.1 hypothetical protein [Natronomonas aquatica]